MSAGVYPSQQTHSKSARKVSNISHIAEFWGVYLAEVIGGFIRFYGWGPHLGNLDDLYPRAEIHIDQPQVPKPVCFLAHEKGKFCPRYRHQRHHRQQCNFTLKLQLPMSAAASDEARRREASTDCSICRPFHTIEGNSIIEKS